MLLRLHKNEKRNVTDGLENAEPAILNHYKDILKQCLTPAKEDKTNDEHDRLFEDEDYVAPKESVEEQLDAKNLDLICWFEIN